VGQYSDYNIRVIDSTLSTHTHQQACFFLFFREQYLDFLFFRTTESHGKTRWILTPPVPEALEFACSWITHSLSLTSSNLQAVGVPDTTRCLEGQRDECVTKK
jgi:hypothetical protein